MNVERSSFFQRHSGAFLVAAIFLLCAAALNHIRVSEKAAWQQRAEQALAELEESHPKAVHISEVSALVDGKSHRAAVTFLKEHAPIDGNAKAQVNAYREGCSSYVKEYIEIVELDGLITLKEMEAIEGLVSIDRQKGEC